MGYHAGKALVRYIPVLIWNFLAEVKRSVKMEKKKLGKKNTKCTRIFFACFSIVTLPIIPMSIRKLLQGL